MSYAVIELPESGRVARFAKLKAFTGIVRDVEKRVLDRTVAQLTRHSKGRTMAKHFLAECVACCRHAKSRRPIIAQVAAIARHFCPGSRHGTVKSLYCDYRWPSGYEVGNLATNIRKKSRRADRAERVVSPRLIENGYGTSSEGRTDLGFLPLESLQVATDDHRHVIAETLTNNGKSHVMDSSRARLCRPNDLAAAFSGALRRELSRQSSSRVWKAVASAFRPHLRFEC